jgi:hypothetical protein
MQHFLRSTLGRLRKLFNIFPMSSSSSELGSEKKQPASIVWYPIDNPEGKYRYAPIVQGKVLVSNIQLLDLEPGWSIQEHIFGPFFSLRNNETGATKMAKLTAGASCGAERAGKVELVHVPLTPYCWTGPSRQHAIEFDWCDSMLATPSYVLCASSVSARLLLIHKATYEVFPIQMVELDNGFLCNTRYHHTDQLLVLNHIDIEDKAGKDDHFELTAWSLDSLVLKKPAPQVVASGFTRAQWPQVLLGLDKGLDTSLRFPIEQVRAGNDAERIQLQERLGLTFDHSCHLMLRRYNGPWMDACTEIVHLEDRVVFEVGKQWKGVDSDNDNDSDSDESNRVLQGRLVRGDYETKAFHKQTGQSLVTAKPFDNRSLSRLYTIRELPATAPRGISESGSKSHVDRPKDTKVFRCRAIEGHRVLDFQTDIDELVNGNCRMMFNRGMGRCH